MKKGNGVIYFLLLFIASLLAELYCMLQFRNDYITIIGVGIVTLIAAYLVMDGIKGWWTRYLNDRDDMQRVIQDELLEQLDERIKDSAKLQKALYVTVKKMFPVLEEEKDQIAAIKGEIVSDLSESQITAAKLIIKYNREDNRRMESTQKEMQEDMQKELERIGTLIDTWKNSEKGSKENGSVDLAPLMSIINQNNSDMKREVSDGFRSVDDGLDELKDAMASLEQVMSSVSLREEEQPARKPRTTRKRAKVAGKQEEKKQEESAQAESVQPDPVIEEARAGAGQMVQEAAAAVVKELESLPEPSVEESAPELPVEEPVPEPSVEEAEPEPAVDLSDPNKQLSPDEIAALFASAGSGATEVTASEPEPQPEPEPEPAPEPEPVDPNKPMSPEEIAALFASMGQ